MYTIGIDPAGGVWSDASIAVITRTKLKEHFGKGVPPYFFFDLLGTGVTVYMGNVVPFFSYRLRLGKRVAFDTLRLNPICEYGQVITIGTQNEVIEGMCRSLYLEAKKVLASDIVAISGSYKTPPLIDTLCENYRYNHNYPIVLQGDTYPPEVLTPVMVWMQNYVEWWEKFSGEKV